MQLEDSLKIKNYLENHDDWKDLEFVSSTIKDAGFKIFLVGGSLRDILVGRRVHDFDLSTDATPKEIESLFDKVLMHGAEFGTATVVLEKNTFEITMFRSDMGIKDNRRPESVEPTSSEHDVLRRDFTVNALMYDIFDFEFLDFVDGKVDLDNKLIRSVGPSAQRFDEDHLRMLRAVRFVGDLGFDIEKKTLSSIKKMKWKVQGLSAERKTNEWVKLMVSTHRLKALKLCDDVGLFEILFDLNSFYLNILGIPKNHHPFALGFLHLERYDKEYTNVEMNEDERFIESMVLMMTPLFFTGPPIKLFKKGALGLDFRESIFSSFSFKKKWVQQIEGITRVLILFFSEEKPAKILSEMTQYSSPRSFFRVLHSINEGKYFETRKKRILKSLVPYIEENKFPERLVKGTDLIKQGHAPGPGIGIRLDELYGEQLLADTNE